MPRLVSALIGQCDLHELLIERVEIRFLRSNLATPQRFVIFKPSSFTQAALMFERCTWSRFLPSIRTSFVSPSRFGEWTTPTS